MCKLLGIKNNYYTLMLFKFVLSINKEYDTIIEEYCLVFYT